MHKPLWQGRAWVLVLLAILMLGVLVSTVKHKLSGGTGEHHSQPRANAYVLPKEFTLDAKVERDAQGRVYVSGTTNFPNGMKMWVDVERGRLPLGAPNVIAGDDEVFVRNGGFRTVGLLAKYRNPNFTSEMESVPSLRSLKFLSRPLRGGRYRVHFTAYFNRIWQSEAVFTELGRESGTNLHGKLLKKTDPDVVDSPKLLDYTTTITLPPISREAKAVTLVKSAVLTVVGVGKSATNVESGVRIFMLTVPGLTPAKGWSATPERGATYRVSYDFINGNAGEQQAIWSTDLSTGRVNYVNENAKHFSWIPSH